MLDAGEDGQHLPQCGVRAERTKAEPRNTKVLSDFSDDELAALLDTFQTIERRAASVRAHAKRFAPVVVEP